MKTTYFPCVRGTMGDWVYYVTVMGVGDLVKYVHFAEEVSPNQQLDTMIQREVSDRSKVIAEYLRTSEQRFFGSLIVAAYDGKPRFRQIKLGDASLLDQIEDRVGVLQFDGSEQYYALDGQHRLAAFKIEQERDPERYKGDQISMIVICHDKDKEGLTRARRLFTTVNRYAKKTSPATHTAMSEDNGVAIVTRRLIREHPLFKERIKVMVIGKNGKPKIAAGNAMSAADKRYLMAIETFRKCNQHLLPPELTDEFSRDQQIPSFESLESAYASISGLWNKIIEAVEPWKALLDTKATVEKLRAANGGHILVRPIGITAFVGAIGSAPETTTAHMRTVVSKFQELDSAPWRGVLWNSATKRMAVTVSAEKLARRLWRYLLGLDENKAALEADWQAYIDPGGKGPRLRLPVPPPSASK